MSLKKIVLALATTMALNGCSANIEAPGFPARMRNPFELEKSDYVINQKEAHLSTPSLYNTASVESIEYTTSTTYEK